MFLHSYNPLHNSHDRGNYVRGSRFMDLIIFNYINQFALRWIWLDTIGIFFAYFFEYVLVICLFLYLFINFKKRWKAISAAFISAILARFVIVNLIRLFWQRQRPFLENNVNLLVNYFNHYKEPSFPSGHTAFYFALATVIFYKNKIIGSLLFIGAFLICLGRVFIGIHWPSDILAGAVIGILVGWLVNKIFKKF